jgi:hypothetical protein
MAKNMARIKDGVVTNIEWCSDNVIQTDTLIDIEDRLVNIGNTYTEGKFYDNGIEVLTEKEILYKQLEEYEKELASLDAALLDAQYNILVGGI